jgi:hypothetical protein
MAARARRTACEAQLLAFEFLEHLLDAGARGMEFQGPTVTLDGTLSIAGPQVRGAETLPPLG